MYLAHSSIPGLKDALEEEMANTLYSCGLEICDRVYGYSPRDCSVSHINTEAIEQLSALHRL